MQQLKTEPDNETVRALLLEKVTKENSGRLTCADEAKNPLLRQNRGQHTGILALCGSVSTLHSVEFWNAIGRRVIDIDNRL